MKLEQALTKHNINSDWIVLNAWRGSIAHGTWVPKEDPNSIDDKDTMGVVVPGVSHYLGMDQYGSHGTREIKEGEWDIVFYEARKFIGLLENGNPNVLSLLWLPRNLYISKKQAGEILIENRNLFVGSHVFHSFAGYANRQLHKMTHFPDVKQAYMGQKRAELVEQFGYDCYLEKETEFLTERGWRKFDNVGDLRLATVVPDSGKMEFQSPISYTDEIRSTKAYALEPYGSRAVITPGHKILVSRAHRNPKNNFRSEYLEESAYWQLRSIQEIIEGRYSHYHIRRAPEPRLPEYRDVDDEYLKLAGVYLSEGCSQFRDKDQLMFKNIRITQTKEGIFWDIMDDLMKSFPSMKRYDYTKETVWMLHGDIAKRINYDFGHKKGKRLPDWCFKISARQAMLLWNHLMPGDGHYHIKESFDTYYTSVKQLADDIQAMMISAGIHCVINGPYLSESEYGSVWMYHVNRYNNERVHTLKLRKNPPSTGSKSQGAPVKAKYFENERWVCFEVPNGTLITRNSGLPAIQGNCKNAAHLIRLLRMCIEFLKDGELIVDRGGLDATQLLDIKRGEWPIEKVQEESERLFRRAEDAYDRSTLPARPDHDKIKELAIDVVRFELKERQEL